MVAPITAPATTPAPIAIGVRSRCGGRGGGGRGVVVVGAARKAGATVGVAYCALLGGGVAAAEPGTVLGAAGPAGGAGGRGGGCRRPSPARCSGPRRQRGEPAAGAGRLPAAGSAELRQRARRQEAFLP